MIRVGVLTISDRAYSGEYEDESGPVIREIVETSLPRGQVHLEVLDNGVGIPAARLEKIFDIFESSKGNRGSGLGLAVSQKIAKEHGGKISVSSKIGQGSRFVIELPIRTCSDAMVEDGYLETRLDLPHSPISSSNEE